MLRRNRLKPQQSASPIPAGCIQETSLLHDSDILTHINSRTRANSKGYSVTKNIRNREIDSSWLYRSPCEISCGLLPKDNRAEIIDKYSNHIFCGKYSHTGAYYMTASQDAKIKLYDTNTWKIVKQINARGISWSIIDTDYSNDERFVIYSSWSPYVHLWNIEDEKGAHEALNCVGDDGRSCLFSVRFSPDSRMILAGCSDENLYLYDVDRRENVISVHAHDHDINSVAFADDSSQVVFSASDDRLIKVWDRRILGSSSSSNQQHLASGALCGHLEGITFISSKGDGRYIISNGKDQRLKLWDIRMMINEKEAIKIAKERNYSYFDYRYGYPFDENTPPLSVDRSVCSFVGHNVYGTLIRCYFSPVHTTGQRYVYSGCFSGNVNVYDLMTGQCAAVLVGHKDPVRDVSWHPYRIVNPYQPVHSGTVPFENGSFNVAVSLLLVLVVIFFPCAC